MMTVIKQREDRMLRSIVALAAIAVAGTFATAASAQVFETSKSTFEANKSTTGPAFSWRYFGTQLENDPFRVVLMQQQLHLPGRPGDPFHTHNGDQWEVVLEGEITFTVRGQPPRVLKAGDFVYIPRGTIHRNENRSNLPTRTMELLIVDKGKPQRNLVAD
jgi:quercetin dioxygenase-like cupin family protein